MMRAIKHFWSDRSGAYAMLFGVLCIPIVMSVGVAVDYSRAFSATRHAQEVADGAVLALASSGETSMVKLTQLANDHIQANSRGNVIEDIGIRTLIQDGKAISLSLEGEVPTMFMSLAHIDSMDIGVTSAADRAVTGTMEVALVLDNTFSMTETDAKGVKKIDALKLAAMGLINVLMSPETDIRVTLVPYADYVNVGVKHRNEKWLDIEKDKVTGTDKKCEKKTTKSVCEKAATYACTKVVDGVEQAATCGGGNIAGTCKDVTVKEYDSCTGGLSNHTWYGCVASRKLGKIKLKDSDKITPYPGYVATSRGCPTEIQPLTSDKASILAGINAMKESNGGYKPLTYIPSGLMWGLNVLTPEEPFAEAAELDPLNRKPRKVLVLMTDGENTLRYNANLSGKDSTDGKHITAAVDSTGKFTPVGAAQVSVTNSDTLEICSNIKAKGIEVYTVALAVDSTDGKAILEQCASDAAHYFDAADSDALNTAFSDIGESLSVVRLTQ